MAFSSGRPPLMLNPPFENAAKPKLLNLPPITPAFKAGTPSGLRPEKDRSSMSFASTVLRTATSVCSGVASAVTVTASVSAPVSSAMLIVCAAPASSVTFWRSAFLNPWSSADTSYLPPGKFGIVKYPDESVTVVRVSWVSVLVTDTVTPGTTPPWASFTVPEIWPRSNCAAAGNAVSSTQPSAAAQYRRNPLINEPPPESINCPEWTFKDFQDTRDGEATPHRYGCQDPRSSQLPVTSSQ